MSIIRFLPFTFKELGLCLIFTRPSLSLENIFNREGIVEVDSSTSRLYLGMDFVKGYLNNLSGFVSNLLDDPKPKTTDLSPESCDDDLKSEISVEASPGDSSEQSSFKLLNWIPKLTIPAENAVVYYMNALATFGSGQPEEPENDMEREKSESSVIVDSPRVETPIEPPAESAVIDAPIDERETACTDWMSELSSRTEEVWKQVKQDIQEIVTVISTEPKDAVARTASSMRQHLSAVADAAKHMDPSQFSLLPESKESFSDAASDASAERTGPPIPADPPNLSDLKSDLSQFFSGVMSALFKPEESTQPPLLDRREARLRILRADPATYEQEPPPPPAHLGLPNYTDWRSAYFDEATCQPLPGVPLSSCRDATNANRDTDQVLAPQPPSPEQLLEENPFMRRYLSQLVRVEGQADGQGITDADFWSRYYYRVWLLDVTEQRRQRLVERVQSKTRNSGLTTTDEGCQRGVETDSDSSDWFSHSDTEAGRPEATTSSALPSSTESSFERTSTTTSRSETERSPTEPHKRLGRQRKRRSRKRVEGDQHIGSYQSDSCSEPLDQPSDSESGLVSAKRETPEIAEPTDVQKITDMASAPEVNVDNSVLAESADDVATSGSSSLVVLSNSDDERDFDATLVGPRAHSLAVSATAGIRQSSHVALPNNGHQGNLSEPNSDDWDDLCETDVSQLPQSSPARNEEATKTDNQPVSDDWDNWS